jgi:hypothetical protein
VSGLNQRFAKPPYSARGTGGSNPPLSANKNNCPRRGIFVFGQMPSLLEHLEENENDWGKALQLFLLKLPTRGITTERSNPLSPS